ncbi:MAG: peptidoglycan DD-metalloendopeptidase family protein [Lysobacter sp.]
MAEFPNGGDPGNHVVIHHSNGEFSLLCHMQHGSLKVAEGQQVEQEQEIGLLGSSGDSSSPHVHHQLQDGPR